jgi:hypothetical protein
MKQLIRHTTVHRPALTPYGPVLLLLSCFLLFTQCGPADRETGLLETVRKYLYAPGTQPGSADFFGRTILALYKSEDGQKADDNEIHNFLEPVLADLGLKVTYWDVDEAMPTLFDLGGIRAVISWFRSGTMQNPDQYLSFLDQAIGSGRKVVIIGNMGAYEYKTTDGTEEYVDQALVNLTLGKLGLWYQGDWTDDPGVIRIAHKVPEIVDTGDEQDAARSAFYYRFLPVDKDLQVYLSLTRSDKPFAPSPVIVTNRNGGFILSGYIYDMKDRKPRMLINFNEFLSRALFTRARSERVGLLADMTDPDLKRLAGYAADTLKRVGLDAAVIPGEQFANLVPGDLLQFTALGLLLKNDRGLLPELFTGFFAQGGGLASFVGGTFPVLAPVFKAAAQSGSAAKGFEIKPGLAMGRGAGLTNPDAPWNAGALVPESGVTVLGTDISGRTPLVWSAAQDKGRIIIWNWDGFLSGNLIGLLLESLLYVRPVGAALTLGFGHMFIDDWPAPMYNTVKEPVTTTDTQFYTTVWWPDVKNILESRGIAYSAYMIFNYNDIVTPPFTGGEFFLADNMSSVRMAREILAQGTELELHGYNHMSLTREQTKVNINAWPSVDNMIASLEHGRKTWVNLFGAETLPFAYVAVNNIVSQDGIVALHRVFPTIRIIAALHWGQGEETFTPIGPHPVIPGIYYLPRLTYGYQNTVPLRNLLVSGMCGPGLVSHFIHPDDVYDPARSGGKTWPQLKKELGDLLDFARYNYPWISWLSLHAAYERLSVYDAAACAFTWGNNTLTIDASPGLLLRVRANSYRLQGMTGARLVYAYENMPYLILETTANRVVLSFTSR